MNAHMNTEVIKSPYVLPTVYHGNITQKKTILDPVANKTDYKLPTVSSEVLEKFTPSLHIVPIEEPQPLDKELIRKHCMPLLIRIRKRKMKKHKLRKLRKRMIFLNRKLTARKKAKKEKLMRAHELECKRKGEEFSADKFIEEKIALAREGGWHIDVWKEYRQKKAEMQQ